MTWPQPKLRQVSQLTGTKVLVVRPLLCDRGGHASRGGGKGAAMLCVGSTLVREHAWCGCRVPVVNIIIITSTTRQVNTQYGILHTTHLRPCPEDCRHEALKMAHNECCLLCELYYPGILTWLVDRHTFLCTWLLAVRHLGLLSYQHEARKHNKPFQVDSTKSIAHIEIPSNAHG